MDYWLHIVILISLYVILGLSLNAVLGYGGLLSLCQGAFYGMGAYCAGTLMVKCGWGLPSAVGASLLVGAVASLAIGVPSLRLRGDYFTLATMAFQAIVFSIMYNCEDLTGGPYGLSRIPRPGIFSNGRMSMVQFCFFSVVMASCAVIIYWQFSRSPYGRAQRAVREDEVAAMAAGKSPAYFRLTAFVMSGAGAAVAGAMYASYVGFIEPTSFGLSESIFILAAVIIGGSGNLRGPVAGACVVVLLPEFLRFLSLPEALAANLRQVIYGLLLILAMRLRPQGLAGRYAFE